MIECDDVLKNKLNRETSKIAWSELERFYARGVVFAVDPALDLIAVAIAMHQDDKSTVEAWLSEGGLVRVGDSQAQQWTDSHQTLWAVVVAPWVLVQEPQNDKDNKQ